MKLGTPEKGLVILVVLVMFGLSFFTWTHAPCDLWKYSKAGDTPARCLMKREGE